MNTDSPTPPETPSPSTPAPHKINWALCLGLLLAPAVLTGMATTLKLDTASYVSTLLGSFAAALFSASILVRRVSPNQIFLGYVLLVPLLGAVSLGFCFVGCSMGYFLMK